jgi:hypothetical protein
MGYTKTKSGMTNILNCVRLWMRSFHDDRQTAL